ncbi:DUF2332 domain-containing protein [Oceanobacillus bengalensis]|uniref:DUF2332 domain-containing protein n=1 Tax=Oceanobacillus bengalensis TaxID=1435466 RepID=A0A494Z3W1_9BACI|nr:DUF2332 domain-containing protein [Oceanobacillus bengalensis]RKQ17170.1 DUF2332 domain-containing protein [Oceanobacillus bengalensis]
MEQNILSEKFINFAIKECKGSSQLYEYLSLKVAEDKEILKLASHAREGQPVPNLLFGAVHYLLLKGKTHNLKEFYPSITKKSRSVEESYAYFKDFCELYTDEVIPILKNKLVQTNEVRRCSYLFPTFKYIYDIVKKPLALIEIGTSAGLQLLWDKYGYSYETNEIYGDKNSEVHISSQIIGENPPFLHGGIPPVTSRIGIDLNIIDLTNNEDYLWLNALIWPNHNERRDLFKKAARYIRANPLTLIEGDGVKLLPELSKDISREYSICIFHTHVANQMPLDMKKRLLEQVKMIGADREIFHVYNNIQDRDLHLDYYIDGKEYANKVGKTDGHGRWFSWEL